MSKQPMQITLDKTIKWLDKTGNNILMQRAGISSAKLSSMLPAFSSIDMPSPATKKWRKKLMHCLGPCVMPGNYSDSSRVSNSMVNSLSWLRREILHPHQSSSSLQALASFSYSTGCTTTCRSCRSSTWSQWTVNRWGKRVPHAGSLPSSQPWYWA